MNTPPAFDDSSRERLLAAALPHVMFDGWSETAFRAAAADVGIGLALARVACPRGGIDLAADYHRTGDRKMVARLMAADLSSMRFRDRIAAAVRLRLQEADRDVVRRGAALFALPQNMGLGTELTWGTADAMWRTLGDTSTDVNWYSKRAILAAVYSATVLYWLGDDSDGQEATWAFLDRRIEGVMRFEKAKADLRASPWGKFLAGPLRILGSVRAPGPRSDDLPGRERG